MDVYIYITQKKSVLNMFFFAEKSMFIPLSDVVFWQKNMWKIPRVYTCNYDVGFIVAILSVLPCSAVSSSSSQLRSRKPSHNSSSKKLWTSMFFDATPGSFFNRVLFSSTFFFKTNVFLFLKKQKIKRGMQMFFFPFKRRCFLVGNFDGVLMCQDQQPCAWWDKVLQRLLTCATPKFFFSSR